MSDGQADQETPVDRSKLPPETLRLIQRYLDVRSVRLARSSQAAYERDLEDFAAHIHPTGLLEAREDDVARWLSDRTRDDDDPTDPRPWSARSAERRLSSVRRFYRWAARTLNDDGSGMLIGHNPAESVERRSYQRPDPVRVSVDFIEQVFEWCEQQLTLGDDALAIRAALDIAMLRLGYNFGLRINAIRTLRLDDMDRERQEFVVREKGGKKRRFPLTGIVASDLSRWLSFRSRVKSAPGNAAFVFIHPRTGRRVSEKYLGRRLKLIGEALGLTEREVEQLSAHALRHARGWHGIEAGESLPEVQAILGHRTVNTTIVYTAPNQEQLYGLLKRSASTHAIRKPGGSSSSTGGTDEDRSD